MHISSFKIGVSKVQVFGNFEPSPMYYIFILFSDLYYIEVSHLSVTRNLELVVYIWTVIIYHFLANLTCIIYIFCFVHLICQGHLA